MLGLAKRIKAKILQASTVKYMATQTYILKQKNIGQCKPDTRSATTKENAVRIVVYELSYSNNVRIKIVRIFNTYGPRMHPNDGLWYQIS